MPDNVTFPPQGYHFRTEELPLLYLLGNNPRRQDVCPLSGQRWQGGEEFARLYAVLNDPQGLRHQHYQAGWVFRTAYPQ